MANNFSASALPSLIKTYLAEEAPLVSQEKMASLHQHLHQLNQDLNQAEARLNLLEETLKLRRNN